MKKTITGLLILSMLAAIIFAFGGCKKKDLATYDVSKFTETIDLNKYECVFFDDFDQELDREIWGDTRQGTRRDGFWTKNLAYTDGEGHLVIRTEERGSRYCSDTHERQVNGYNGSVVKVQYDDCIPFGMIAGDFGDLSLLTSHTSDMVGYVILERFNDLGNAFTAYKTGSATEKISLADAKMDNDPYEEFYAVATDLFNYYCFVPDIKKVVTSKGSSALVGVNYSIDKVGETKVDSQTTLSLRSVLAHLFGFNSEEQFVACAETLATTYEEYRLSLTDTYEEYFEDITNGTAVLSALENGCFRTQDGSFIFPIAFQNDSNFILTYVIVDGEGGVSVWVNDVEAALSAVNYDADHFTGETVTNETYCKNTMFVTGPEGVYSGAIRTLDYYMHGFGYYEICCTLPDTKGIWHAFWLMCGEVLSEENGSADGVEIDVFEYLPARDAVNVALHWDGYDSAHQNAHMRYEGTDLANGEFHTFGVLWDETGYAYYIDGRKVWKSTGDGVCHDDGYMIISTEYGEWGDWVSSLDTKDLPVDWIIDYVKVYDKIPE